MVDIELDRFKIEISLTDYAIACGYCIDVRESSPNSKVLRRVSDDDKIIVATDKDGHGVYFSVRDESDHGTIIDFVRRRKGLSLGRVRCELRPWIGIMGGEQNRSIPQKKPELVTRDREAVRLAFAETHPVKRSRYLHSRNILSVTLRDKRFESVIREDRHRNVIFPHYDLKGLCGFELKNLNFTGFSPGGIKGVWCSANMKTATIAVIVESAIDALSHAQLMRTDSTVAYISIGGQLSRYQRDLIQGVFGRRGNIGLVKVATDNDLAGDKLSEEICGLLPDRIILERLVPNVGKDWNEVLLG